MANLRKKTIRTWDGGIQTSTRDSSLDSSYGAQLIKHFDIYSDPHKLIPMPSWETFTTSPEEAYGIRVMGGFSDTVLGVGKGLSNWYGSAWAYRVKVTVVAAKFLATGFPLRVNLASLPAGFWSNVKSDGGDIRVTNATNQPIAFEVENFDSTGHTGDLWVSSSTLTVSTADFVYVYYGNATATAIQNGVGSSDVANQPKNAWAGLPFAFSFPSDVQNNTDPTELFTTAPSYIAGAFGKAITTSGNIETDPADQVGLSSSDISVSFMIKITSAPGGTVTIIDDNNGTWDIQVSTARKLLWTVQGTGGIATKTSTAALTIGTWYVVDCIYDGNYYITINNSKETFVDNIGNYDDDLVNNTLRINTNSVCQVAQVWAFSDDLTVNQSTTKYNNLADNSNFWTIGSQETFAALTKTYSGVQVYAKSIVSGNWYEYLAAQQPVKDLTKFPVNGFLEEDGDWYFVVSSIVDDQGFLFLAKTDDFQVIDASHLLLGTLDEAEKVRPVADSPADTNIYFTYGRPSLGSIGDPGSAADFVAGGTVNSIVPWRSYLAAGYTNRTRALIELWDQVSANPIEKIDAGSGRLRVVGNASDILFVAIDNFIDDTVLSSGRPTMEIRKYVGNSQMKSVVRVAVPVNYTGWVDNWERAVSFFKLRRNTETLFYAKLPSNEAGTTFNQGFWAVGVNSDGELALSLMIDTSEFEPPENTHGFAKQVFYIEKDGGINRLSTTVYNKTSNYTTRFQNEGNTEIEKALKGIEIVTEPLDSGQTISVYYRLGEDATRVKIKDFTGAGFIAGEAVADTTDANLPNYQEIEFQIESTGGKAAVTEFSYKFEYTSDII